MHASSNVVFNKYLTFKIIRVHDYKIFISIEVTIGSSSVPNSLSTFVGQFEGQFLFFFFKIRAVRLVARALRSVSQGTAHRTGNLLIACNLSSRIKPAGLIFGDYCYSPTALYNGALNRVVGSKRFSTWRHYSFMRAASSTSMTARPPRSASWHRGGHTQRCRIRFPS